ncbi:hypothetical protein B4Q13_17490, partial [Lacticaseibacillus rhamnosus]
MSSRIEVVECAGKVIVVGSNDLQSLYVANNVCSAVDYFRNLGGNVGVAGMVINKADGPLWALAAVPMPDQRVLLASSETTPVRGGPRRSGCGIRPPDDRKESRSSITRTSSASRRYRRRRDARSRRAAP